jgi:ATP-dependent helicase YprA (DUF1998 family)
LRLLQSVVGRITGWVPAEGSDVALWHVEHVDGDEEDLEEHEVIECLVDTESTEQAATQEQSPSESASSSAGKSKVAKSMSNQSLASIASSKAQAAKSSASAGAGAGAGLKLRNSMNGEDEWSETGEDNMVVDTADDEGSVPEVVVEPQLIRSFHGSGRNHTPFKPFMIGLVGLTNEMIRCHQQLVDAVKKKNPEYSKDIRKVWESSVRDAETLDELKELLLVRD